MPSLQGDTPRTRVDTGKVGFQLMWFRKIFRFLASSKVQVHQDQPELPKWLFHIQSNNEKMPYFRFKFTQNETFTDFWNSDVSMWLEVHFDFRFQWIHIFSHAVSMKLQTANDATSANLNLRKQQFQRHHCSISLKAWKARNAWKSRKAQKIQKLRMAKRT